ncbi:hypothetical protein COJ46_21935 [Bacillus sp. AFS077874]|uniref:hypothetical protein n=1 Tax=Bacillus sp. AFS077874 TaxID=2033513 RepID=UPI000BF8B2E6|nr:hypothetical protein [Bacillus sp. AFS077874]PET71586.1 hypothetical protein CN514_06655 [Bacillus sp. AFS001701]PFM75326.1 hypothetical protein COJ46_21935 [Bacillus sp. AFS077874]
MRAFILIFILFFLVQNTTKMVDFINITVANRNISLVIIVIFNALVVGIVSKLTKKEPEIKNM